MPTIFTCPHCRKSCETSGKDTGDSIKCEWCGTVFIATTDGTSPKEESEHDAAVNPSVRIEEDSDDKTAVVDNTVPEYTIDDARSLWQDAVGSDQSEGESIKVRESSRKSAASSTTAHLFSHKISRHGTASSGSNQFELIELIGKGGMGAVFSAKQASMDREIAIKMILPEQAGSESIKSKFVSEALVTGELDHPNIVPVHEVGKTADGTLFYAMKEVKGTNWKDVVEEKSEYENLQILMNVCDAMAFAHDHGVIHRDLKPENIMLGDYGEVLVMDWGLAVCTEEGGKAEPITDKMSKAGTPSYMAPEMATCEGARLGPWSDIYLLGGILYEIVTGLKPHSGEGGIYRCIYHAMSNQIQESDAEGELKDIALKAMATDPQERYASVKDFQTAIREYQSHLESIAVCEKAREDLKKAGMKGDYELFAQAVYGFKQALELWQENRDAKEGLRKAQLAYADCAFQKADLDLAASLLNDESSEHRELAQAVAKTRKTRNIKQRRLRTLMVAVPLLVISIPLLIYWQKRSIEEEARQRESKAIAGFIAEAKASMEKGFHKKAEEAFAKVLALDERNLDAREGLQQSREEQDIERALADAGKMHQASRTEMALGVLMGLQQRFPDEVRIREAMYRISGMSTLSVRCDLGEITKASLDSLGSRPDSKAVPVEELLGSGISVAPGWYWLSLWYRKPKETGDSGAHLLRYLLFIHRSTPYRIHVRRVPVKPDSASAGKLTRLLQMARPGLILSLAPGVHRLLDNTKLNTPNVIVESEQALQPAKVMMTRLRVEKTWDIRFSNLEFEAVRGANLEDEWQKRRISLKNTVHFKMDNATLCHLALNADRCDGIEISHTRFTNIDKLWVHHRVEIGNSLRVVLRRCTVIRVDGVGFRTFDFSDVDGLLVLDNQVERSGLTGIHAYDCTNSVIAGNRLDDHHEGNTRLVQTSNAIFVWNQSTALATQHGRFYSLQLLGSDRALVQHNTYSGCDVGLHLQLSSHGLYYNNIVRGLQAGMKLSGGHNNHVRDNIFAGSKTPLVGDGEYWGSVVMRRNLIDKPVNEKGMQNARLTIADNTVRSFKLGKPEQDAPYYPITFGDKDGETINGAAFGPQLACRSVCLQTAGSIADRMLGFSGNDASIAIPEKLGQPLGRRLRNVWRLIQEIGAPQAVTTPWLGDDREAAADVPAKDAGTVSTVPATADELHVMLKKVNQKYNGKGSFTVKNSRIVQVDLHSTGVSDISPLRGLELTQVNLQGCREITDLSPLKGMALRSLNVLSCEKITDFSALIGMPISELQLGRTQIRSLAFLKNMPLRTLGLNATSTAELSVLTGIQLEELSIADTQVTDLTPLKDMPLKRLSLDNTRVTDLSPLIGMPLMILSLRNTHVSDLSPLKGMNLKSIRFNAANIVKGIESLRNMRSLETIAEERTRLIPVAEFWKKFDIRRKEIENRRIDTRFYTMIQAAKAKKNWAGALSLGEQWAAERADSSSALNSYAWELLTSKDEKLRDPKTALVYAQKAVELTQNKSPAILDTLSLALFRNGKVKEAIDIQKKAISLLPASIKAAQRKEYEDRLRQYEAAFRKTGGKN